MSLNAIIGCETGLLKGLDIPAERSTNFSHPDEIKRGNGIEQICWADDSERKVYFATKQGAVRSFDTENNEFGDLCSVAGDSLVRGLCPIGSDIATCTEAGALQIFTKCDSNEPTSEYVVKESLGSCGANVCCMRQDPSRPTVLATGGKENDLKLWDANNLDKPTFIAKNVRHDQLDLRVPVWIRDIGFMPETRCVATATSYHQVRVYDPTGPQRRPVLDFSVGSHPLTCLAFVPNSRKVIVGDSFGGMALLDLRAKGKILRRYKGIAGGIRCIRCHASEPIVVSCGLDRFVFVHRLDRQQPLSKIYLKSSLNTLLLTSSPILNASDDKSNEDSRKARKRKLEVDDDSIDDADNDALWNEMENIS